jgi:UDP-4-amino-4,6-dideoxy-N-acetyl-beta-L-altrosamine transaminase
MIPYGRQDITAEDVAAVTRVLQSDFLTQGEEVPRFEASVAAYCGVAHGVAVNSATSALHIACLALDLGPGDWLWTSPITFVASANCARYCGAGVDFVDIDPLTFNMSVEALRAKLSQAKQAGRLPKIVVPVHMAGQSCDMVGIHALAKEYGFRIIEDASHAIGGRYGHEPVGSCRYSDITVFSFHPVKIITTAEGGLAVTNHPELARRMALLRSHGITRDPAEMTHTSEGAWYYQQVDLGFNYRMTELQAALGSSQMNRLKAYVAQRHALANAYDDMLRDLPLQTPYRAADSYSAFHLYIVNLTGPAAQQRQAVFDALRMRGVGVNVHYIPVHTQPYYQQLGLEVGYSPSSFPCANAYYATALSLPLYATMSQAQQHQVLRALQEVLT